MSHINSSNKVNVGDESSNWVIAFSKIPDGWYVTQQRDFSYIFPMEFKSEQEGIDYFLEDTVLFFSIESEIKHFSIGFDECVLYLDNIGSIIKVGR